MRNEYFLIPANGVDFILLVNAIIYKLQKLDYNHKGDNMESEYTTAEELGSIFKSKLDLYRILTVDSKYANGNCLIENYKYPSYKQCPLEFIRQLIAGEKWYNQF